VSGRAEVSGSGSGIKHEDEKVTRRNATQGSTRSIVAVMVGPKQTIVSVSKLKPLKVKAVSGSVSGSVSDDRVRGNCII